MYFYLIIASCLFTSVLSETNNVCKSFKDYYTIKDNPNCYYNFAADTSVPETIKLSGYPSEEHTLITPDGYILMMHRIPNTNYANPKKSIMFLQHGVYCTSGSFIGLRNESLGFMLADLGYDVWMMNFRGNIYSDKHTNMTVKDAKYWEHSVDDIATDDMSLTLNYISEKTGSKGDIIYVGHSLGTMCGLVYASDRPTEAQKLLKLMIFMGPSYHLAHIISPVGGLAYFANMIYDFIEQFELVVLVSDGNMSTMLFKTVCFSSPRLLEICSELLKLLYGVQNSIKPETIPVMLNILPAGTSIRILKQIANAVTRPISKYDFGFRKNLEVYGQISPPVYDVQKITIPIHMMAAKNDWLTPYRDAKILLNSLPIGVRDGFYSPPVEDFSHMDFILGAHAKKYANDYIINLIKKYN